MGKENSKAYIPAFDRRNYTSIRVYVSPDEPLDIRRKATFERLKKKLERERKTISISNGVLSIDNELVRVF